MRRQAGEERLHNDCTTITKNITLAQTFFMLNRHRESRWFLFSVLFLFLYCGFLFFFRHLLLQLETGGTSILKPESSQILFIAFLILLYHFAFLGLLVFSSLGKWQRIVSILLSLLLTGSLLYGFRQWYVLLTNNPFLSFNNTVTLPWYAQEQTKFFLANTPLILFLLTVFTYRVLLMLRSKETSL
jgi:hypothetical protein